MHKQTQSNICAEQSTATPNEHARWTALRGLLVRKELHKVFCIGCQAAGVEIGFAGKHASHKAITTFAARVLVLTRKSRSNCQAHGLR